MKTIKIGRKTDNDIVINDQTKIVSRYHAVLKINDNGEITICDSSTNGTFINSVKVAKGADVSIEKGDEVRLGPHLLLDWSKIEDSLENRYATKIDTDEKASYSIGTKSDNRIVISDSSDHVSRHHAILKLKVNGSYYIYDQSTNGTYVNGVKIKPKVDYPVSVSDTISLSNTYQLDWNKIPGVLVPKPITDFSSSAKKQVGNYYIRNKIRTKIWIYLIFGLIIAGAVYFGYSKWE